MFKKAAYLILDCETATLPFIKSMDLTPKQKQAISIAKPLIYDIGWVIIQRDGTILKEASYLVQETFFVPNIFNTAYYSSKRPIYMRMLASGETSVKLWNDIASELVQDCASVNWVGAYNAAFDFLKAIPFTERYIEKLYSDDYNRWEYGQRKGAEQIAAKAKPNFKGHKDYENFSFRGLKFPIVDIWRLATEQIINTYLYKNVCAEFPMISASGLYFKTSAETVFRYIDNDYNFEEAHTALDDARIESKIVLNAFNKHKKIEKGVTAFPFRELGTTADFLKTAIKRGKTSQLAIENVLDCMEMYLTGEDGEAIRNAYASRIAKCVVELTALMNSKYGACRHLKFPYYFEERG